jgi:biotin carboxyl carrier protein
LSQVVIRSELNAVVWKIEVKVGDAVEADQPLILLECMKTEIPVPSPCKGRVAEIRVAAQDLVQERQVLLVLER